MPSAVVSGSMREIRDETTIRSKEHGIEELKKLRKVNEKLLQFPISRTKKRVTCFACYLQGDTETGLIPNRSKSLLNVALNFNIITYMCKSLLNAKFLNITCLLYKWIEIIHLLKRIIFVVCKLKSELLILFIYI